MHNYIVDYLPYKSSFLFVGNILQLDLDGVTGDYTLKRDAFFYEDHFAGNPVTPGVIITEIMVQTGLVVLGIYLMLNSAGQDNIESGGRWMPLLTSADVSFFKMVLPGQKVQVISKKQYFRFGKLKCLIEMYDEANELVARGMFAGMIKSADKKDKLL